MFRHLDGIVTAPTAQALGQKGVLDAFLSQRTSTLQELTGRFEANEGYLNVALRLLASQGWLVQHIDGATEEVSTTSRTRARSRSRPSTCTTMSSTS